MMLCKKDFIPHVLAPSFYGLPKIQKHGNHLRPIISIREAVTYGVVKELAIILRPLVGHPPIASETLNILWSTSRLCSYNRRSANIL